MKKNSLVIFAILITTFAPLSYASANCGGSYTVFPTFTAVYFGSSESSTALTVVDGGTEYLVACTDTEWESVSLSGWETGWHSFKVYETDECISTPDYYSNNYSSCYSFAAPVY